MKKRILIFAAAAAFAALPAASADWKKEAIDGLIGEMKTLTDQLGALPGMESTASYAVYSTIFAMCVTFAGSAESPLPRAAINRAAKIQGTLLRGKSPSDDAIHRLGVDCLAHAEKDMIRQGSSKEEARKFLSQSLSIGGGLNFGGN